MHERAVPIGILEPGNLVGPGSRSHDVRVAIPVHVNRGRAMRNAAAEMT